MTNHDDTTGADEEVSDLRARIDYLERIAKAYQEVAVDRAEKLEEARKVARRLVCSNDEDDPELAEEMAIIAGWPR